MPAPYCGDDFVGVRGPCEGLGLLIMLFEEVVDGGLEVDDATLAKRREAMLARGADHECGPRRGAGRAGIGFIPLS